MLLNVTTLDLEHFLCLSEKLLPHVAQLLLINKTLCMYVQDKVTEHGSYIGHYIIMVLSQCSG